MACTSIDPVLLRQSHASKVWLKTFVLLAVARQVPPRRNLRSVFFFFFYLSVARQLVLHALNKGEAFF